ncbi:hypothetical protein POM88_046452 [Heracleum sosnowskyi]|uniref:Translin n=1 Tax=Heracleum sosnowskyi TaxID=360622 RepID=A0AAD8H9A2_9APIA|nr:hypothetical protein POM88_046452 [Heracleum sosnowskyi]
MASESSPCLTSNPMADAFSNYADYLNHLNDKRERVVKASRDITVNSKKVIFQVHRVSRICRGCNFCRTGSLLKLAEINAALLPLSGSSVEPFQINVLDYIPGLADLTGELMRLAMGRICDRELEYAKKICRFVQDTRIPSYPY